MPWKVRHMSCLGIQIQVRSSLHAPQSSLPSLLVAYGEILARRALIPPPNGVADLLVLRLLECGLVVLLALAEEAFLHEVDAFVKSVYATRKNVDK